MMSSDCGSKVPATAREPVSLLGKRTPSSSPNAITSIANGRRSPARVQRRHGLDRGDHAEIAVVVAGVADGVDVRAEQQRRQRPGRSPG